jgi:NPCBM/NEW2 domain
MGLLLLATLLAVSPDARVETLSGESVAGSLTALGQDAISLATGAGPRTIPLKELLGITFSEPTAAGSGPPAAWITLTDHSQLLATEYTVADSQARLALAGGGTVEIPTRAIDSVRFREHTGALVDQWNEIDQADRTSDLIVIRKNDAIDFLSGVLRGVAGDVVQFELDGEVLKFKRSKVDGLLYHRSTRAAAPATATHGTLTDVGGSQWQVESLVLAGESLHLRTAAGVEIDRPLAQLARIDFSQGNLQFLGDLKSESILWTPYLGNADDSAAARQFFRPRVDRAADGSPLRLEGREYAKGLTLHSRTEMSFRLPEKYRSFRAIAGIDDCARPAGHVRLVIRGDDRILFEEILSGRDAPRLFELDITGISRLKLLVDFGDDLDVGDWLDLCEARILK